MPCPLPRRAKLATALCLLAASGARAQSGPPAPARTPAAAPARFSWALGGLRRDGLLDEPAWQRADSITDFTQRDPREGEPASERTVVRLVGTAEGLWVGLWAYEAEPVEIRRAQLRRDADFGTDDSFTLMNDAQIVTFESQNTDWDGIWDARARVTSWGWQAELFLPWQTLRYPANAASVGLNLKRYVRHRNEEALWRAWRRPEGIRFLEREGTLEGLRDLPPRAAAEVRPYLASTGRLAERAFLDGGRDSVIAPSGADGTAGLDVKLAPTPTLTLDLTFNTDFAQAEADRQVVNLTRFPLFFPERRTFFTEGAGIFDFGRTQQTQLFYSRRIGLGEGGIAIPLLAGARLIGRAGAQQLGLLATRTGGDDPATDLVARVKRDVLGRGYVGAMATLQETKNAPPSPAGGVDFNFPFIVKGQNLIFLGNFAAQQDSARGHGATHARFMVDYPNDHADIVVRVDRVGEGFAPPLGFVSQDGIWRLGGQAEITPRPERWHIRQFSFVPLSWNVVMNLDGSPNNADFEVRPLGAEFESGDDFEVNLQRFRDAPREEFEVFEGTDIAAGTYQWDRIEVQFGSSGKRRLAFDVSASAGGYYDGTGTELSIELRGRVEPHVLASLEYQVDDFHRGDAGFTAATARLRLDYAASARLTTTLFGQYDSESRRVALNARLRWTRSPGSDLYVVWNSAWQAGLSGGAQGVEWGRPTRGALVVKYVQYWRR